MPPLASTFAAKHSPALSSLPLPPLSSQSQSPSHRTPTMDTSSCSLSVPPAASRQGNIVMFFALFCLFRSGWKGSASPRWSSCLSGRRIWFPVGQPTWRGRQGTAIRARVSASFPLRCRWHRQSRAQGWWSVVGFGRRGERVHATPTVLFQLHLTALGRAGDIIYRPRRPLNHTTLAAAPVKRPEPGLRYLFPEIHFLGVGDPSAPARTTKDTERDTARPST